MSCKAAGDVIKKNTNVGDGHAASGYFVRWIGYPVEAETDCGNRRQACPLAYYEHLQRYGFQEFVLALEYIAEVIKQYFLNFTHFQNDLTVDLKQMQVTTTWNVTMNG